MPTITREHGEAIVRKLGATLQTRRSAHDLAVVYHDGIRIVAFGLRRGSRKDIGHGHLPGSLHVTPRECLLLAQCPMTRDQWIEKLREKKIVG